MLACQLKVRMEQLLNYVRGYSFGKLTYPNGGRFGPILRPYISLLLVEEGCGTMRTEHATVRVEAGQTGIAAATTSFEFHYPKGQSSTFIWCEGFLPYLQTPDSQLVRAHHAPIATSPRLTQLVQFGLELGHISSPERNALRDALGHVCCRAYLFEARQSEANRKIPKVIIDARRYIQEHLADESLDVLAVAGSCGVTPQHLVSAFKKHIGTTPSRYLWRLRAASARELLIHSPLSQSQIAFRCGYKSMPHFSRSIKKLFGMTAAELRKDMGFTSPSDTEESVVDIVF